MGKALQGNDYIFTYPFTALVGQGRLKKALLLNAVNPRLGGVLVRGEKGTAKSTAVRALASLLPEIWVVADCPYNCDPDRPEDYCPSCREAQVAARGALPKPVKYGKDSRARDIAGNRGIGWEAGLPGQGGYPQEYQGRRDLLGVLEIGRPVSLAAARRQVRVVDLPVSATEDRVVGSLDFEYAVKYGVPRFEPGLLARANRGFLYVDEINLLDDHLVDSLLDAAAMGVNTVEREGISFSHRADFVLVGTMNPEEGELRPQLVDRFGFCVPVEGLRDPRERVEIARLREDFERDPLEFLACREKEQQGLRERITSARERLDRVTMRGELLELITRLSLGSRAAGHRADIAMAAGASTIAAWDGRLQVEEGDVYEAAGLVLYHRAREAPPSTGQESSPPAPGEGLPPDRDSEPGETDNREPPGEPGPGCEYPDEGEEQGALPQGTEDREEGEGAPGSPSGEQGALSLDQVIYGVGEPFPVRRLCTPKDRVFRKGPGRRSRTRSANRAGRYVRSTLERKNNDLAFDATMRAASPFQGRRYRDGVAIAIEPGDIREKVREKRTGNFMLFLVDASGSMGARRRMVEAKGAVLSLLLDAYQKRDRVGMVAFRGEGADLLLPPTNSVERAEKLLAELPTGGKTPLSAGLAKAYEVALGNLHRDPHLSPLLIVISDGRANVSLGQDKPLVEARRMARFISQEERIRSLVVDVEKPGFLSFGLARELADYLEGDYYRVGDLKVDSLVEAVHKAL